MTVTSQDGHLSAGAWATCGVTKSNKDNREKLLGYTESYNFTDVKFSEDQLVYRLVQSNVVSLECILQDGPPQSDSRTWNVTGHISWDLDFLLLFSPH